MQGFVSGDNVEQSMGVTGVNCCYETGWKMFFSPLAGCVHAEPPSFPWEFCPQERHKPHKRINKTPIFCQKNLIRKLSLNLCTECNASLWVRFSCVNIGVQQHFSCLRASENVSMRLTNETGPHAPLGKCRPKWVALGHLPEHNRA